MRYSDLIAHEVESLPAEKQVKILAFIAFFKARYWPAELTLAPKTAEEIETFF